MSLNLFLKRITTEILRNSASQYNVGKNIHSRFLWSLPKVASEGPRNYSSSSSTSHFESVVEPAYLDEGGSSTPLYDLVNVQLKGYDFPILESYGKYVHNTAHRFGIDVEDGWGTPCKKLKVTRLKPESTVVEAEYHLNVYERNVQLADVPAPLLPLFINFIEAVLPAGVTMNVRPHDPEETNVRFIPDFKLLELKTELEGMTKPREKK